MEHRISSISRSAPVSCPVRRVFSRLCRSAKTPIARVITRKGFSDLEISRLEIDPCSYSDFDSFKVDYQLVSYLSKYKGLNTGIDTKAVALTNFAIGEAICAVSNERFRRHKPTIVDPIIHRAQQLISKCLGKFSLAVLDGQERWGPGASSDLPRRRAYRDTKMAELPFSCTAEALPYFKACIQSDLRWSEIVLGMIPDGEFSLLNISFKVVAGSNIVTVDKNAKTDRTIAIEPRGNMFLQKSVGSYVRRRLKRFGVDLDNQGLNQDLAAKAVDLDLATIDLKMASDTISRNLVFELLPIEWALYLDKIRSKSYVLESQTRRFDKFSSMGNGFTFELESLIFWALTKASMIDETASFAIYGDDIICPCVDSHVVISTLSYCGFETNVSKTFVEGPFRESCGRHYFNGREVTPIYQKEIVVDVKSHIRFLNRLKRYAIKHNDGTRLLPSVNSVWASEYSRLSGWRPQLPCGAEGDDGYLVSHAEVFGLKTYKQSYGHKFDIVIQRPERIPAFESALFAYSLRLNHAVDNTFEDLSLSVGSAVRFQKLIADGNKISNDTVYDGYIESMEELVSPLIRGTRWIEPSWEFCLD